MFDGNGETEDVKKVQKKKEKRSLYIKTALVRGGVVTIVRRQLVAVVRRQLVAVFARMDSYGVVVPAKRAQCTDV